MAKSNKLLISGIQKLYSALRNLEQFDKTNDLYENISCLDNFLSEYRNVTFVIQKSLKDTIFFQDYETLRNQYLKNELGKWFVEKRNEISKENPFKLEKVVKATIYDRAESIQLATGVFTADDDADFESIVESLRGFLNKHNPIETHFSIEFIYREAGTEENLFDKLLPGIFMMREFFLALNQKVCDTSWQFQNLLSKINEMNILKVDKTALFVVDYAYYGTKDTFIRGERVDYVLPNKRLPVAVFDALPIPIPDLGDTLTGKTLYHVFIRCVTKHALIYRAQNNHIMSTFITIYDDNTLTIEPFDASTRTTVYRKIDAIAAKIKSGTEKIKAVILINEMWQYENLDVLGKDYEERVATGNPISLFCGHYIDKDLNQYFLSFESDKINSDEYISSVLKGQDIELGSSLFLSPIYKAFTETNVV